MGEDQELMLVSDTSNSEQSENETKGVKFTKNCDNLFSASRGLTRGIVRKTCHFDVPSDSRYCFDE